jgi:hypothetical protein
VWGPYWPLPRGSYKTLIAFDRLDDSDVPDIYMGQVEVIAGDKVLAAIEVHLSKPSQHQSQDFLDPIDIEFEIENDQAPIEIRLWTPGDVKFRIHSLRVVRKTEQIITPST